jgi:hypothetical protein
VSKSSNVLNDFPVTETTKALLRVTPYDFDDPIFKEAFKIYHDFSAAMIGIIGIVVLLRLTVLSARMERVNKIGEVFRDALSCYFVLGFYPKIFSWITVIVSQLQDGILDFRMPAGQELHAIVSGATNQALASVLTLALMVFLGPIGGLISICIFALLYLPGIIFYLYFWAFKIGVGILIIGAPIFIVCGTVLRVGIALTAHFYMLICMVTWPLMWAAIGRIGFASAGAMNFWEAFAFTLILGLFQLFSPIFFLLMMRGISPGESVTAGAIKIGSQIGKMAMAAPLGAFAAPAIGVVGAMGTFGKFAAGRIGAAAAGRSSSITSMVVSSGFASSMWRRSIGGAQSGASRLVNAARHFRLASENQRKNSFFGGGAGSLDFSGRAARMGEHVAAAIDLKKSGQSDMMPWHQNPKVMSMSVRDFARYGLIRRAQKTSALSYAGTAGFLMGGKNSSGARSGIINDVPTPQPISRPVLQLPPVNPKPGQIIHLGGPTVGGKKVRIMSADATTWQRLESKKRSYDWRSVDFQVPMANGTFRQVTAVAAFSKRTNQPRMYFVRK